MKRFLNLIIVTTLVGQAWAYDFKSGSLYYNVISDSTVEITTSSDNYSGLTTITIPETVIYRNIEYNVTQIGQSAFNNCSLTNISIPNTITYISDNAFDNATNLQFNEYDKAFYLGNSANPYVVLVKVKTTDITSCEISNDCKIIVSRAFQNCNKLPTITIPNSVIYIGEGAFNGCSALQSITLPFVGDMQRAFYRIFNNATYSDNYFNLDTRPFGHIFGTTDYEGSTATEQLYILDGKLRATSDGSSSFRKTYYIPTALKNVSITRSNHIPYAAFYNCSGLESVNISNSVAVICDRAFYNCTSLKKQVIDDGVICIGTNAFNGCVSLTAVDIPNSVTSICSEAFYNCSGLTSVAIPNTVNLMEWSVFKDCINLTIFCQAKVKHSGWVDDWNVNECPVIWGTQRVKVTVSANNSDYGQVSGSGTYFTGTEAIVAASANIGYKFIKWNDGSTSNPRLFNVIGSTNLTAIFEEENNSNDPHSVDTICVVIRDTIYNIITKTDTFFIKASDTIFYSSTDTIYSVVNNRDTVYNIGIDTIHNVISRVDTIYDFINKTDTIYTIISKYDTVYSKQIDTIYNVTNNVDTVYNFINKTDTIFIVATIRDTVYEFDKNVKMYSVRVASANTKMGICIGSGKYKKGDEIEIVAIEKYGYHFCQWSDGNTENPRLIDINGACNFTAQFDVNNYFVLAEVNESTMGSVEGSAEYAYLSRTQLKAVPNAGYQFKEWSDGETSNPRNILVFSDTTFTAVFIANEATAVSESAADNLLVYTHGNTIIVENATEEIRVYDAMGRMIGRDAINRVRTEIRVNATGVYIVKVGNVAKRVMVN